MVRDRDLSARELVQSSLDRIEELNPALNAFVEVDAERALLAADEVGSGDERPFAGVPIAIKNNRAVKGLRLTLRLLADGRSREHLRHQHHAPSARSRVRDRRHHHAARVRHPAHQRGAPVRADPQPLGPAANARRLLGRRGCGGGGRHGARRAWLRRRRVDPHPRCLLRAGRAEARHAGRVSSAPELGDSPLAVDGVLTRTVAETAAILDVLAGYETGDATWAPPSSEPFAAARRAPTDLGRHGDAPSADRGEHAPAGPGRVVDPMCAQAVAEAADAAALARPRGRGGRSAVADRGLERDVRRRVLDSHRHVDRLLGRGRRARADGRGHGADELGDLLDDQADERACRGALSQCSCSASRASSSPSSNPTTRCSRPRSPSGRCRWARSTRPRPIRWRRLPARVSSRRSRPIFNATGQPAVSLPLFQGEDGLPLGVQIVGRPAGEAELLALATQLEQARPWAERRAPLAACGDRSESSPASVLRARPASAAA